MAVKTKTNTKPTPKPADPLGRLLADNQRIAVHLAECRKDLRASESELQEVRAAIKWLKNPYNNWPMGLTYKQKLDELGRILAAIFSEIPAQSVVCTALYNAMKEIEAHALKHGEINVAATKAHYWFPTVALSVSLKGEDKGHESTERQAVSIPPNLSGDTAA